MTPQAATAMQPVKTSVPVTQIQTENVLDRFQQVYDSIARRAFDIFDANGRWFGNELGDWLIAESEMLHPVHLEMAESDDNLTVRAEVPGFSTKEVEINVEPRRLTITGKHEAKEEGKKGKTIYSERCAKEVLRSIDLPAEVDSSKVTAILKDGILSIELPKAAHAKTVRVEPKAA
ncbi:MAG: Hsp20/alpha crystallin family protein [Acidobacteriia bacterium]|nr:Hsp20/alpha crystallin family protein [Terriglobia bacterium]